MRPTRQFIVALITVVALLSFRDRSAADEPVTNDRPRIIATTDGEIDDRCSLVRFLLYANEWDIEGIIYCSSKFHWKGHDWAGEQWIERDIDLYASFYDNLKKHAAGFPTPEYLRSVTYIGNINDVGEMEKETPGSNRIVDVLLDDEPGPVYLQAWGGTNTIARALKTIQEKHPHEVQRVSKKTVIYIILDQDKTFREYILPNWPDIQVLGSFRQFGCIAYGWQNAIPASWHRFYDGAWMRENILHDHGPLCARYEAHRDGRFRSEGDSPAFMHQIRTGLGSMVHPSYGGWGGRFEREEGTKNLWRGARDDGDRNKPIWRWSEDFQNDWAARADWCVKSVRDANHNPTAIVNGTDGKDILRIQATAGDVVSLSAEGSSDPDGDTLSYQWFYYPDAGTFEEDAAIESASEVRAKFTVPADCRAQEHHIILTVRDRGNPNLVAYRRVIVESPSIVDHSPPSTPTGVVARAQGETQASVHWEPAADAESGIRRYLIYRNGSKVAESKTHSFTDRQLREATNYAYEISAINGCAKEGDRSAVSRIRTAPDKTPPEVNSVHSSGKRIVVSFNEPVSASDAQRLSNYALNDGTVQVSSAMLRDDHRAVVLEPDALVDGQTYRLAVSGIHDRARRPNKLATGSSIDFTYRTRVPLVQIGNGGTESPLSLHGDIRPESDGSFYLKESEPWKWIAVGEREEPLPSLEGLESFTLLGWAKPESLSTGMGGNRIAFNLNYNRSGFDLVHHQDGRLRLAVNQWPDSVKNDSSRGMLQKGKWIFFAVTYDSTAPKDNVHWYFGDEETPAQLDRATSYNRGMTGKDCGPLTIGNYNQTIHRHGKDRQFRGWLRGFTIYGSTTGNDGALDVESIREHQQ